MVSGQFFKKTKIKVNNHGLPTAPFVMKMVGNYLVVTFGLMLFHSTNISEFWAVLCRIPEAWNGGLFFDMPTMVNAAICSIALIYVDLGRVVSQQEALSSPVCGDIPLGTYHCLEIIAILLFGIFDNNQFIYFQF